MFPGSHIDAVSTLVRQERLGATPLLEHCRHKTKQREPQGSNCTMMHFLERMCSLPRLVSSLWNQSLQNKPWFCLKRNPNARFSEAQGQGPSLQEPVWTVKEDVELKAAFLFQRNWDATVHVVDLYFHCKHLQYRFFERILTFSNNPLMLGADF